MRELGNIGVHALVPTRPTYGRDRPSCQTWLWIPATWDTRRTGKRLTDGSTRAHLALGSTDGTTTYSGREVGSQL